jgi:hypothetical protein
MKLCAFHKDDLRTKLQQHGVAPGHGPSAPIHVAESLVIAKTLAAEPSVLGSPVCPICYLLVPSWLTAVAVHIARKARND